MIGLITSDSPQIECVQRCRIVVSVSKVKSQAMITLSIVCPSVSAVKLQRNVAYAHCF